METLGWQCRNVFVCVYFYQCKDSEEALAASQGGKMFCVGFIHPKLGRGAIGGRWAWREGGA